MTVQKLFHEPSPTLKVLTRDSRNPKNVSLLSPRQHKQVLPEFDCDQCTWHYPYQTVPSATTCSSGVACTTPAAMHASTTTPIVSPNSVLPGPSSSDSGVTTPHSHGFPGTPKTTLPFHSGTPTPEPLPSSAEYHQLIPEAFLAAVHAVFCEIKTMLPRSHWQRFSYSSYWWRTNWRPTSR